MNDAKIVIFGQLTKDPAVFERDNGKLIVINVAVTTKKKDVNGDNIANFYNVTYRGPVELEKKLQKGTLVYVVGDFYQEARIKDNTPYQRLNIEATEIRALYNMKPRDEESAKRMNIIKYMNEKIREDGNIELDDVKNFFDENDVTE